VHNALIAYGSVTASPCRHGLALSQQARCKRRMR